MMLRCFFLVCVAKGWVALRVSRVLGGRRCAVHEAPASSPSTSVADGSVPVSDKSAMPLSTLSAKVKEKLLASTLEVQVPGPGAAREGAYFERSAPRAALRINLDVLNWRAKRERRRGRHDVARKLWGLCIELDKFDGRAWIALSRDAQLQRRDVSRAAELLAESLRLNPKSAYVRQAYGVLLERQGRRVSALEQYERATRDDPSHAASWVAKARLISRGSCEADAEDDANVLEGRRCFEAALQADARNYYALSAWADLEARLGRVEEARALFARAAKANPRNAATYAAWAGLEERRGLGIARVRDGVPNSFFRILTCGVFGEWGLRLVCLGSRGVTRWRGVCWKKPYCRPVRRGAPEHSLERDRTPFHRMCWKRIPVGPPEERTKRAHINIRVETLFRRASSSRRRTRRTRRTRAR